MLRRPPLDFTLCLLCSALLCCSQPGCLEPSTSAAPSLVPVSGQVLLDGEPIAGAKVVFLPKRLFSADSRVQPAASALTDQQGNFSLQTAGQPGAKTGPYWVLLSKLDNLREDGIDPESKEEPKGKPVEPGSMPESSRQQLEEVFPEFFNSATRLEFMVSDQGTASARFELSIFDRPLDPRRRQEDTEGRE